MHENTNLVSSYHQEKQNDSSHIEILINDFKEDPLYSFLKKAGYEKLIITNRMREELYIGRTYSVEQSADITNTDPISIRNLLNGANSNIMPHYLLCEKEKKFWHIPAQTVVKIRLIFLFKEKFKSYSWNQIASIGIGESQPFIAVIMNPAEQKALLEKQISLLEERNQTLEETINHIVNGDLQISLEKFITEKFNSVIKTNELALEDNKNEVKKLEESFEEYKKESNSLIEKRYKEARYNLNRRRAEADWLEQWYSKQSLFSRLFNKQPSDTEMKVGIEVLLKKYEEEDDFHKAADR